jgi:hypothetical protein
MDTLAKPARIIGKKMVLIFIQSRKRSFFEHLSGIE